MNLYFILLNEVCIGANVADCGYRESRLYFPFHAGRHDRNPVQSLRSKKKSIFLTHPLLHHEVQLCLDKNINGKGLKWEYGMHSIKPQKDT
jgi:hypothetical protein